MAHGSLSKSGRDADTIRTAVARGNIGANTQADADLVLEATEDRHIRGLMVQTAMDLGEDGLVQIEVSKSSQSTLIEGTGENTEATGSGVLAYTFSKSDSTNGWALDGDNYVTLNGVDDPAGGVEWEEGDELNIHGDNQTASTQAYRVIIYYERVSDC